MSTLFEIQRGPPSTLSQVGLERETEVTPRPMQVPESLHPPGAITR
jgi:hypothetical protein